MSETTPIPFASTANVYGPITPTRMFERTFKLLKENPTLFFGIVLVVIAVEVVVGIVLAFSGFSMRHVGDSQHPLSSALLLLPLSLLGGAMIYVITQIAQGALFYATQTVLAGGSISVGGACSMAAEKVGRLIAVSLLIAFRVLLYLMLIFGGFLALLVAVGLAAGVLSAHSGQPAFHLGQMPSPGILAAAAALMLLLMVVYFIALLWLAARYAMSIPVCLAENRGAADAIRRAISLSGGSRGRIYALFIFVGCISLAIAALTLPLQLILAHQTHAHHAVHPASVGLITLAVAGFRLLIGGALIAFTGVATALCYFDLRVRKEGFGQVPQTPAAPQKEAAADATLQPPADPGVDLPAEGLPPAPSQ